MTFYKQEINRNIFKQKVATACVNFALLKHAKGKPQTDKLGCKCTLVANFANYMALKYLQMDTHMALYFFKQGLPQFFHLINFANITRFRLLKREIVSRI